MVAIGSDHGGFELKESVMQYLTEQKIEYRDYGCHDEKVSCDYPVYGKEVAQAVANGTCSKGIVICTTGIGISIAANKVSGVRAALCTNSYMAKMTRLHNNANILALGAAVVGKGLALEIVEAFLQTKFSGVERHQNRINQIEE